MNSENYFKLKSELKELAKEIKSAKRIKKEIEVAYSDIAKFKKNVTMQHTKDIVAKWKTWGDKYRSLCDAINNVSSLKYKFRHKHIIYSMARGKTYEQIEQKVRKGNEPDWFTIEKLKEDYGFDEARETVSSA